MDKEDRIRDAALRIYCASWVQNEVGFGLSYGEAYDHAVQLDRVIELKQKMATPAPIQKPKMTLQQKLEAAVLAAAKTILGSKKFVERVTENLVVWVGRGGYAEIRLNDGKEDFGLRDAVSGTVVYVLNDGCVETFRPGNWLVELARLGREAEEENRRRADEEALQQHEEHKRRFAPVDGGSALLPEDYLIAFEGPFKEEE